MNKFSRRELLYLSASLSLLFPLQAYAMKEENNAKINDYPTTILALKKAFKAETIAYRHYLAYVEKALKEDYPNIAYMFYAFSFSEKIHADNYKRILNELGSDIAKVLVQINVHDTKSNLQKAAEKELEKINKFYPELLVTLEPELYEEAIVNCMYSWKSHRQHEATVTEIQKYSGMFFGSVAEKIEDMNLDFHICNICGSTIDEKPQSPCEICNKSLSHYFKVDRPMKKVI